MFDAIKSINNIITFEKSYCLIKLTTVRISTYYVYMLICIVTRISFLVDFNDNPIEQ